MDTHSVIMCLGAKGKQYRLNFIAQETEYSYDLTWICILIVTTLLLFTKISENFDREKERKKKTQTGSDGYYRRVSKILKLTFSVSTNILCDNAAITILTQPN
jgi:hypothetical protein